MDTAGQSESGNEAVKRRLVPQLVLHVQQTQQNLALIAVETAVQICMRRLVVPAEFLAIRRRVEPFTQRLHIVVHVDRPFRNTNLYHNSPRKAIDFSMFFH